MIKTKKTNYYSFLINDMRFDPDQAIITKMEKKILQVEDANKKCFYCKTKENQMLEVCQDCISLVGNSEKINKQLEILKSFKPTLERNKIKLTEQRSTWNEQQKKLTKVYMKISSWERLKSPEEYKEEIKQVQATINELHNIKGKLNREIYKLQRDKERFLPLVKKYRGLLSSDQATIKLRANTNKNASCHTCHEYIKMKEPIRYWGRGQGYQHITCFFAYLIKNNYPFFFIRKSTEKYEQGLLREYIKNL